MSFWRVLMRHLRTAGWAAPIIAALVLATGAAASGRATRAAANFRIAVTEEIAFSQGECCAFWYFGTPTAVTVPRVGPATLTTFFIQCFAVSVCTPQNSQLTLTFEAKNGDKLVLQGYAPNLGTFTSTADASTLTVAGTWSVLPSSTGRFAGYVGLGTFSLVLVQPFGSFGGSEQMTFSGTLKQS
jgi:hypothetical protein